LQRHLTVPGTCGGLRPDGFLYGHSGPPGLGNCARTPCQACVPRIGVSSPTVTARRCLDTLDPPISSATWVTRVASLPAPERVFCVTRADLPVRTHACYACERTRPCAWEPRFSGAALAGTGGGCAECTPRPGDARLVSVRAEPGAAEKQLRELAGSSAAGRYGMSPCGPHSGTRCARPQMMIHRDSRALLPDKHLPAWRGERS
jgi:hypothetical protein